MDTMHKIKTNVFIIIELVVLFVLLPVLYWFDLIPFHKIIPLLFLFGYCAVVLYRHKRISASKFLFAANWKVILIRFFIIGLAIFGLLKMFSPAPLFADLNENRKLLLMLVLYPLLSAFPQEVIFREFFFFRYQNLFNHSSLLLIVNIVLFSFAHIYFSSWIVIAFTLVGGLIFSLTFFKTRSLMVVTIEHSLYGLLILSSGLNIYFYKAF